MVKGVKLVVVSMGTVLFPFLLNRSIQYKLGFFVFFNKTFLLFQVFVCLFVLLFVYIIVEQWRRSGGPHQVWTDGGRSPRHLDTFSNFLLLTAHYTHINTLFVLLLLLPTYTYIYIPSIHIYIYIYTMLSKISELWTYHSLLLLVTVPILDQLQLPSITW